MPFDYIPIIRTDIYFSKARRFCTLEGPTWQNDLAFNHLSQALDFLQELDCEEALLIAGGHEVTIRFAGKLHQPTSDHPECAEPSATGVVMGT